MNNLFKTQKIYYLKYKMYIDQEDYTITEKSINDTLNSKLPFGIKELIHKGKGGSSIIYEAKINTNNSDVIIKVADKVKNKNSIYSEIKILNKLNHNNIIKIYGYSVGKGNDISFMMLEKGKCDLRVLLYKFLNRKISTESFLNYICVQILNGLKYLKKCNIIHHDIKPQNIVINDFIEIKIIDFSASKDISNINDKEIKLSYRGTTFYMAPEVIKTKTIKLKDYHKIDLFSLGVSLYTLAFGEYPFNLKSEDAYNDDIIYNKIMSDWKVKNINGTEYSTHFINFLNGLLEKNIEKRMNIYEAIDNYWVKGSKILMEEKENIYNANCFLSNLITDHFLRFNKYIKSNCLKFLL